MRPLLVTMMHDVPAAPRNTDVLVRIETDRRLGHEWDEWDGAPLPNGGDFSAPLSRFFAAAAGALAAIAGSGAALTFLLAPRLAAIADPIPGALYAAWGALLALGLLWLALVAASCALGRPLLPERLAERGPLGRLMRPASLLAQLLGGRRDYVDHAAVLVHERLAWARERRVGAGELLILIPRCLSRATMDGVLEIARRHGVSAFVATRGQLARRAIAERRPRAVVAVACERDMVSGLRDVAGKVPVLGLTMQLPAGPCRDATVDLDRLDAFVRRWLA